MDMLLSTGERISCALCAMAINDLGCRAISLTGSQAGIVTDTSHTKARILDVRADRIRQALDDGMRSEEHTSELQSRQYLVCRLLLEKKNKNNPEGTHV